ncbi:hypothetical protein HY090_02300 [Candidatus Kaiserbacteria bacterium]|nr:hypothetical protein [Candidatus Kaiserbacteria bacterium]
MQKNYLPILLVIGAILAGGAILFSHGGNPVAPQTALAAKFNELSKHGNSSCSRSFADSIDAMPNGARLQGSCCSPMNLRRYEEQIDGLKKYQNISKIPGDPYDIDASLAKNLKSHYDDTLTPQEQEIYDYAMANSMEKGPCCCKCWRWYVYGGLAKLLIQKYHFTGEQITEVWDLSDGCGGNDE